MQNNVKVKSRKLEAKLRKTIKTNCQEIDYYKGEFFKLEKKMMFLKLNYKILRRKVQN